MRRRDQIGPAGNTFRSLCHKFKESSKFLGFERATQILFGRELDFACRDDILGATLLQLPDDLTDNAKKDFEKRLIRPSLIQGYLDGWSDKPGKQAAALAAFKALEKWAVVRDLLPRSITLGVETGKPQGGHIPWTAQNVRLGAQHARPDIGRAIVLLANTGQRGSDVVRMGPTDLETFDGHDGIRIVQIKTGREVWCPISAELEAELERWLREGHRQQTGPFLLDQWGQPWTRQRLTNAWSYERDTNPHLLELKKAGLVLHGLRGHACVRLLRAGANTRQVADMVGMSEPMVARYTRFSEQKANALAAVYHLEKAANKMRIKKD
jgi:integrase